MIIARVTLDERGEYLLLGLTSENLRRLAKGQPIRVTPESHGPGIPEGWRLLIVHGETERAIVDVLRNAGLFSPDTKVLALPKTADDHPAS